MKITALILSLLLPWCAAADDNFIRLDAAQQKASGIAVVPLDSLRSSGERRLPAQAVVPPARLEIVGAPLAGMVTGVKVAYGEQVRRGQVLAQIQGPQMLELQREFSGARAQADVAAENRRRDEALLADGIISQSRLSATQAADRQATALLAEKRAALQLAQMPEPGADGRGISGQAAVRAPFDGVVLDAPAQPGQRVDAMTVLFKLGRVAPLWLEIQATPAQAAGLAPGDPVSVPGCAGSGRLTLVAPHLNPATQALLLRAEFPNADACVKPFQFVQAQIAPAQATADSAARAWRVPNGALARHQEQVWLFAQTQGGFVPVPVRVIDETERSTLIAAREDVRQAAPLRGDLSIAVKGIATLKAVWLGLGADGSK